MRPILFPRFIRGDCNEDGSVNIADPICLLEWMFVGTPSGCLSLSDVNGDMAVNVSDPVSLLLFLFFDHVPPVDPFPECGNGMSEADGLIGCETPPEVCQWQGG